MSNQISIVKEPLYGTVNWNGVEFIYTPKEGFTGIDYYVYTITDGETTQTLTKYINTENLAPVASDINLTINAADLTTINVDAYVSDPDKRIYPIEVSEISKPLFGIASFKGNIITYQSTGYNAKEVFYYTITDGQYSSTGKIQLNVINGANPQIPDYILNALSTIESDMNNIASHSANWDNSYTLLCTYSADWNLMNPDRYNLVSNIVETNSADWNLVASNKDNFLATYSILCSNSADWNSTLSAINYITSVYSSNSSDWATSYSLLCANSGNWEQNIIDIDSLTNYFSSNSSDWESTYNIVCATSAFWDKRPLANYLSANSGYWQNTYNTVCAYSGDWEDVYNNLNTISSIYYTNSADWITTYNTVCSTSAFWDKRPLTNYLSAVSGDWVSTYNTVCAYSGTWDSYVSAFSALSSDYNSVSGNWQSTYNTVCGTSAFWDKIPLTNYLSAVSGDWVSTYNTVCAYSGTWDSLTNSVSVLSTTYSNNSGNWQNTYNTVYAKSANWDNTSVRTTISINSADWTAGFNVLTSSSGDWNSGYQTVTSLSSDYYALSSNWQTAYTTVCGQSANWGDRSGYNTLTANSGYWTSVYTTVCSKSADWNSVSAVYVKYDLAYNTLTGTSGNWDSTYNTLCANSANWDNTLTVINSNSGKWLSGGTDVNITTNNLIVSGNAVFYGSLTAEGTTTQLNTEVVATSAFAIVNTGFVDAMRVTKTQTTGALATFNSNGNPILYVSPLSVVGINTNTPNEALTVSGNISASGTVYGKLPSEYTTFQTNSSKYESAYSFVNSNSAGFTNLLNNKPNYDNSFTYVTGVSSSLNDLIPNRFNYSNASSVVTAKSGDWYSSYTFLSANSSLIGTDSLYRSNKVNYDTAVNTVSSLTSSNAQINFIFDGGGQIVDGGVSGMIQIPYDVNILSWTLFSDVNTTAIIQVLSSNYSLYPTFLEISGLSNRPSLAGTNKSTNSSTLTDWVTGLSANSILKFKLLTNTNATSLTIGIKCSKY